MDHEESDTLVAMAGWVGSRLGGQQGTLWTSHTADSCVIRNLHYAAWTSMAVGAHVLRMSNMFRDGAEAIFRWDSSNAASRKLV